MNRTPKMTPYEVWGACSRCGARTRFADLKRERLTGLLVCSVPVGKRSACLDPWPDVLDFNVSPDRSIEPPPEPLPARWMLDDIFSAGTYHPVSGQTANGPGTPAGWSNAPKAAPDDATRLRALLTTQFQSKGTIDFDGYRGSLNQNQNRDSVVTINPMSYDGTFVPSTSVRTVTPPDQAAEVASAGTGNGETAPFKGLPWTAAKGV